MSTRIIKYNAYKSVNRVLEKHCYTIVTWLSSSKSKSSASLKMELVSIDRLPRLLESHLSKFQSKFISSMPLASFLWSSSCQLLTMEETSAPTPGSRGPCNEHSCRRTYYYFIHWSFALIFFNEKTKFI